MNDLPQTRMPLDDTAASRVTQEALQREADYARAQKLLEILRDRGMISSLEFDKITALNRESFSPALAELMP